MAINTEGMAEGEIKLVDIIINNISFERNRNIQDMQLGLNIQHRFFKAEGGEDVAELSLLIEDKNANANKEFSLKVTVQGYFVANIESDRNYNANMLAIIFPFVRSQITLITAQPNMMPIILPTINIDEFIKSNPQ